MKKLLVILLSALMIFSMVGCNKKVDPNKKSEGTMTYAEFAAAKVDDKVVIEGFVAASQSYWNGATLYVVDGDGGYFVYCDGKGHVDITEQDWNKLGINAGEPYNGLAKEGVKVHVEGYKANWDGEVEIVDAVVTILDTEDKYFPTAVKLDATKSDKWIEDFGNQYVTIENAKVTKAALYKYDGSGEAGQNADLYIDFEIGGNTFTFVVESYLMYEGTETYNAVLALKVGDVVTLTGFMYAYNGAQLHITSVK